WRADSAFGPKAVGSEFWVERLVYSVPSRSSSYREDRRKPRRPLGRMHLQRRRMTESVKANRPLTQQAAGRNVPTSVPSTVLPKFFVPRTEIQFAGPRRSWLPVQRQDSRCKVLGVGLGNRSLIVVAFFDVRVNDNMRDVDAQRPYFTCQHLRQRTQSKLSYRKV